MASVIHVSVRNPTSDDAAVLSAFNTLMTTLRALPGGKPVDAGGTVIGGIKRDGDEVDSTKNRRAFGDPF